MEMVTPLGPYLNDIRGGDTQTTQIMSIVNMTPDSFSDGGERNISNREAFSAFVESQIAAGATILDIGGQSSRPGAPDVTSEEELSRILPAIEIIKSLPCATKVAISVDTYRAAVAEAAISAGAHIVNDISAGSMDPKMLSTIARLGCTYVMMHMRGTPATMMSDENCTYGGSDWSLIRTIGDELRKRIKAAEAAGIRRWRIILDPGIGFSKTTDQSLNVLKHFGSLRKMSGVSSHAWLVGSSRKSFIGKVTGVAEPKDRTWGTAATITPAIWGGARIIRVHDVAEMAAVAKMSDAIINASIPQQGGIFRAKLHPVIR